MRHRFNSLIGAVALAAASQLTAAPMGTVFTYQGRLRETGSPANNLYDFRFTLHADAVASAPTGTPTTVTVNDVPVTNGVFTVDLNFGPAFIGDARWLQIDVRPGESESSAAYTALAPRQNLTPVPQALYASFARNVLGVSWTNISGIAYGASGSSISVARSDHEHFGASWVGNSPEDAGLSVYNAGATGIFGSANAPGGTGVAGRSVGENGSGVAGFAFGSGSEKNGIYGFALNGGNGVRGISDDGTGVLGQTVNGVGVRGVANTTGFSGVGVEGRHEGNGRGVLGSSAGNSGVHGASERSSGVSGTGQIGVNGLTFHPFGTGVSGSASSPDGTGVLAQGSGVSGTALAVDRGALRVIGAGEGTSTAAFVYVVTSSSNNTIDHPMCNNDENALLFVTAKSNPVADPPLAIAGALYYDGTRWHLTGSGTTPLVVGQRFNILIIKR